MKNGSLRAALLVAIAVGGQAHRALGQGYGTDTQNVLTPAAGGMAGVSIAEPQDAPAAVFGNPASLAQFSGTQFTLGGAWVEGYPTTSNNGSLNHGVPFSVTSRTEGFAAPEIAIVQDLRPRGLPGALGLGFGSLSGLGAEYRGLAPAGSFANNVSGEYVVFGINAAAGFDVTERLSAGVAATLGTAFSQLGLVQDSAMVHDYALRGTFGLDYKLNPCNTVGAYYQTKMNFQFPNAFLIPGTETYRSIRMDQPETVGLGLANRSFMDGKLLVAADVYYKLWENADLYQDVFVNQWAFALGTQLTQGKLKYRTGYSYNTNPLNHNVGSSLSGLPVQQAQIQFLQASSMATISQHRITGGVGYEGFLFPNVDLDLFAGGLFKADDQFGDSSVSVAVYYVGMGLTWRDGCCEPCAPTGESQ